MIAAQQLDFSAVLSLGGFLERLGDVLVAGS